MANILQLMTRLFSKLIVPKFYAENAGFFLFVFLILFGVLPGSETIRLHRGIMEAAVSTPTGMLITLFVVLLYTIKCASFCLRQLSLPQNSFVYLLQAHSARRQAAVAGVAYISLFMPLLTYILLAAWVGWQAGYNWGILYLIAVTLVSVALAVLSIVHKINGTTRRSWLQKVRLPFLGISGYYSYFLRYSVRQRKGNFVAIKVFSLAVLQLMIALNREQPNRENICFLIHLCIAAHALLPFYYVQFLEGQMSFLRALPLSLSKRLLLFPATFAVVLLPELLFLIYNAEGVLGSSMVVALYLLAVVRLSLYSVVQYLPQMNNNVYTGIVFCMFFLSLILLASVNMWVFVALEAIIAVFLFLRYYYRFGGAGSFVGS